MGGFVCNQRIAFDIMNPRSRLPTHALHRYICSLSKSEGSWTLQVDSPYHVLASCIVFVYVVPKPVAGHCTSFDSSPLHESKLGRGAVVNRAVLKASFDSSRWNTLNLMGYLNDLGTGWNRTKIT